MTDLPTYSLNMIEFLDLPILGFGIEASTLFMMLWVYAFGLGFCKYFK